MSNKAFLMSEAERLYVYEFNTIEEEITYIAEKIATLINNKIDINKIKICGINDEYIIPIKRIFKYYNIPININNTSLYSTKIVKYFLNNLDKDIKKTLSLIEKNFNLKYQENLNIYNRLLEIINKYTWCNDYTTIKELLINDFKKAIINNKKYQQEIKIINSLTETEKDDYIFLISFNQGIIPKIKKDEDYLNDNLKNILKIDTSIDLNILNKEKWLQEIKTSKLIITYKKSSKSGDFYISSLNDYLNLEIKPIKLDYSKYSNILNKIELTKNIDNLIKYATKENNLDILYNTYYNINYQTYDNQYQKISKEMLKKYLNNKLNLSYSAINNYYHCSYKYYLSNILKLNIYEETFNTIIGNLFHYILSICFEENIDISKEYNEYINKLDYNFNAKERFFLDNLFKELLFIINTIKEQNTYISLNKNYYEEKIEINKNKEDMQIIFKGIIDKIITDDKEEIAAIIDYKTGNPNLNISNIIYGIDLQLPIYIYLTKKKFPNIRIIGFYLQKILNSKLSIDKKHSYNDLKKEKLKLQGYTTNYEEDISKIDNNYQNSKIIKGMKTTSKGLSSKKIYDDRFIDSINKLTDNLIDKAINNIIDANFNINPKRIGINNIGCQYCSYKDIYFMNEKDIISLKEHKNLDFLSNI